MDKKKTTTAKFKWAWVAAAWRHLGELNANAAVAFCCAAMLLLATYSAAFAWGAVAAAVAYAIGFAVLVRVAREDERLAQEGFVHNWIGSAATPAEQQARREHYQGYGLEATLPWAAAAAVAASASPPMVNVDGVPMSADGVTDAHGKPYGVAGDSAGLFNEHTGSFVAENNAYGESMGIGSDAADMHQPHH